MPPQAAHTLFARTSPLNRHASSSSSHTLGSHVSFSQACHRKQLTLLVRTSPFYRHVTASSSESWLTYFLIRSTPPQVACTLDSHASCLQARHSNWLALLVQMPPAYKHPTLIGLHSWFLCLLITSTPPQAALLTQLPNGRPMPPPSKAPPQLTCTLRLPSA
eukprot:1158223-Pelagomonas_calceolata.AAC.1